MTHTWNELEGVSIAETYRLERCLGTEQDTAFFGLTADPDQPRAVVKLMHAQAPDAESQLAAWHRARELSHPHLMAVLDCGESEAAGEPWVYAVFEHPDDSLANAFANGSLGEQDGRDVVAAVRDALCYVHENGLVHGAVDADHIVAVGDRIKLTSDTLRNSGEACRNPETDLGGLEKLTRSLSPAAVMVEEAPGGPAVAEEPATSDDREPPPNESVPAFVEMEREAGKRAPVLMLMGAVAALLIAVVLAATQRSNPAAQAPATSFVPPAQKPVQPASVAYPPPVPSSKPTPRKEPHERWRVVAYTYNHRAQAEHKAQTVNRKWPGFEAVVFTPRGSNAPPYFVALGGPMSRDRAATVQKKALMRGLPRDTFIRNYTN
jgi:hypothetical protein